MRCLFQYCSSYPQNLHVNRASTPNYGHGGVIQHVSEGLVGLRDVPDGHHGPKVAFVAPDEHQRHHHPRPQHQPLRQPLVGLRAEVLFRTNITPIVQYFTLRMSTLFNVAGE